MPGFSPRFRATPRLANWVPPNASFFASNNYVAQGENLPDITTWGLGNLILNEKAYAVFKNVLNNAGEFLPILISDDTYYMFQTLKVIPDIAVNTDKAVDVIDSGVHMGQENVSFDEGALNDDIIFKTKVDKLIFSHCTEQFKTLYDENHFSGLIFEKNIVK
jgi:hypothetical protein